MTALLKISRLILIYLFGFIIGLMLGQVIFGSLLAKADEVEETQEESTNLDDMDNSDSGDSEVALVLHNTEYAVLTAARIHKIDERLIRAIITVESNWNPSAIGSKGEVGLMQINPRFHRAPLLPFYNVMKGTEILKHAIRSCPRSYIRCYNGGVNKRNTNQAREYEKKVKAVYERLKRDDSSGNNKFS